MRATQAASRRTSYGCRTRQWLSSLERISAKLPLSTMNTFKQLCAPTTFEQFCWIRRSRWLVCQQHHQWSSARNRWIGMSFGSYSARLSSTRSCMLAIPLGDACSPVSTVWSRSASRQSSNLYESYSQLVDCRCACVPFSFYARVLFRAGFLTSFDSYRHCSVFREMFTRTWL